MSDAMETEEPRPVPQRAGERLRAVREAEGLTLADIASRTRVPIRHLEAIEASDYAALPSPTYAVGFAKAYARAVGADEVAIAREVRGEQAGVTRPPEYRPYEMADPARVPSRGLALTGVIIALVLVIGAALWFGSGLFRGSDVPEQNAATATPASTATPALPPAAGVQPGGPVTLTATARVWLRVYDADNKTLFMKTLDTGEKYQVPADAKGPMINVGRPDKLQVAIGDRLLPPLGSGERAIKDVPVSAAALEARAAGTPASATSPTGSPEVSPAPAGSSSLGAAPTARTSPRPRATPRPRHTAAPLPRTSATAAPLSNGIY